jgi:hypothetical protein
MNRFKNNSQFGQPSIQNMLLDQEIETNLEDNKNNDHDIFLTSTDLFYLKQIKNIRYSLPWIIITFGLVGNLFILLIFLKKSKRFTSNGLCFSALAISDSLALIFMLMRSMLNLQIISNVTAACKIIKFIYHATLQISSWCLVLLTLDRLIAVLFVFKYNNWCKKWHSLKLLIGLVLTILLFNLHFLIYVSSDIYVDKTRVKQTTTTSTKKYYNHGVLKNSINEIIKIDGPIYTCNVDPNEHPIYFKYIYSQWDIYHSIIYGIIPFIIILTSNILIIIKLTILKNKKNITKSTNMNDSSRSLDKIGISFKSFQITIMLLSIAFVFLLFTSPISIYLMIIHDNLKLMRESKKEYIKVILRYIGYCNNAINFYLYITFSNEFRKEFVKLIKSCFKFKTTVTSCANTATTNLGSNNMLSDKKNNLPIGFKKTSIKRSRLEFKLKEYNNQEDDSIENESFRNPFGTKDHVDAVELFKHNTRNAKLNYYKKENFIENSDSINDIDNKPFLNNKTVLF